MKDYNSPTVEFIEFANTRIDTAGSRCNCYAERWNYDEYDLDDPTATGTCKMETKDFYEIADAAVV